MAQKQKASLSSQQIKEFVQDQKQQETKNRLAQLESDKAILENQLSLINNQNQQLKTDNLKMKEGSRVTPRF